MKRSPALIIFLMFTIAFSMAVMAQADVGAYSEQVQYKPRVDAPKDLDKVLKRLAAGTKAGASAAPAAGQDQITIPVGVFSKDGKFATDVKPDEFQVMVDGQPASVTKVVTNDEPVHVVIVMDVSPSAGNQNERIKDAVLALLESLRPTDQAMVVAFAEKAAVVSDFSADRKQAEKAIKKLEVQDGTSLYATVGELLMSKLSAPPARTAVILLTDGVDTTSTFSYDGSLWAAEHSDLPVFPVYFDTSKDAGTYSGNNSNVPPQVLAAIMGSGVFRGIHPPSSADMKKEYELGRQYLNDLLTLSGGRSVVVADPAKSTAKINSIPTEMRARYYVSFEPAKGSPANQRHTVTIRVKRPGLSILAKSTYIQR